MASRRLNLLALPKNPQMMRCFKAPPGQLLVSVDFASLEPHVLTYFTQDVNLMRVYGPNAPNFSDIYLVAGMKVPGLGDEIRKLYDPINPTPEGVKAAKAKFAKERKELLKPGYLGWCYGLGAETFSIQSELPLQVARNILRALDKQFPGKKALQQRLEKEWAIRGGYVVNGRGRPLPVDFGKKHDLVSRMVQSTGHDCLVRMLFHFNNYRKEHKIKLRSYLCDIHDESVWAVDPEDLGRAEECFEYAFARLNEELNWNVKLRHGGFQYGPDLRIRCEGWENAAQAIIA
jgi:DNA polymerase I-like protein with 3'-5' exonuclease and polymerase domains